MREGIVVSEISAIGDVITGGIVAQAVDDHHPGNAHSAHGGFCLNCKATLGGKHCHDCGQHRHVHRTLAEFWHELLHGVFHFDGKIWRTVPMLFFKPGELTRRYIHGERARFVSPIALFLFSVFAMFAVYGSSGLASTSLNDQGSSFTAELNTGIRTGVAMREAALEALQNDRAAAATKGDKTKAATLDGKIAEEREKIGQAKAATADKGLTEEKLVASMDVDTGIASIDKGFEKAKKNPDLFLYKIQGSAYKYSWAIIPLSLPFLWLIFAWRREFKLYDHIVFITYSLCFMSILLIGLSLAGRANDSLGSSDSVDDALIFATLGLPLVHMFFQLKGTYQLTTGAAVLRTGYLAIASMMVFVLFVLLLLLLGALG